MTKGKRLQSAEVESIIALAGTIRPTDIAFLLNVSKSSVTKYARQEGGFFNNNICQLTGTPPDAWSLTKRGLDVVRGVSNKRRK